MEKATYKFSQRLLNRIYTSNVLKHISNALETLSQNVTFKEHANAIVSDSNLTDAQKRTQLLYLIRSVDVPLLYDFLSDELTSSQYWLFTSDKIDYFDRFVQEFQNATESIKVIHIATAIDLNASDLQTIAESFSTTFGYKIIVDHETNTAIIGGVQVRLENLIFDYSLRTKFQQFQRHWLASLDSLENAVGRNDPALS
jgi:F0F1-type ATP synthase delta subunit